MINKIYYIIRKFYKIIFIVGFISMLLFKIFNTSVFASTNFYDNDANYNQDPSYLIRLDYDNKSNYFLKLFNVAKSSDPELAEEILDYIYNVRQFMYIENINSSTWRIYYVNGQSSNSVNTHLSIGSYTSIPCESYIHNCNFYYEIGWNNGYYINKVVGNPYFTCYVPVPIDLYTSPNVFNYAQAYFQGDFSTLVTILTSIYSDTSDMNEKMDEMIEEQKETNDFLKSEDTSGVDTSYSNPGGSTSDSTESAFNGIFTRFYNAMTSNNNGVNITVPIPFTRNQITIPSNLTRNILAQHMGNLFNDLLPLVWYFLVGLYILKDMAKIIQDIKSGDIMTKTDTNIKTDML